MILTLCPHSPDQEGIDARRLVSAALAAKEPEFNQIGAHGLQVVHFSGPVELRSYERQLDVAGRAHDAMIVGQAVFMTRDELRLCSEMYVIDEPHLVRIISNRSRTEFEQFERLYQPVYSALAELQSRRSEFNIGLERLAPARAA